MNKLRSPLVIVIVVLAFVAGFFGGREFKNYEIKKAITDAFKITPSTNDTSTTSTTQVEQLKKEGSNFIDKKMGDEVALATLKLKVTNSEEKSILNQTYGSPLVAKEGAKFVVVSLDVTNTTSSQFDFTDDLLIVDDKDRETHPYSDAYASSDNYLRYRTLTPGIKESGLTAYEVPKDASSYHLVAPKAGSKDVYRIYLKK